VISANKNTSDGVSIAREGEAKTLRFIAWWPRLLLDRPLQLCIINRIKIVLVRKTTHGKQISKPVEMTQRTLIYLGEHNDTRKLGFGVIGDSGMEDEDPWVTSVQISFSVTK